MTLTYLAYLKPMKMTDVPVSSAETYINDNDWVLEQKMDGARALIIWTYDSGFRWLASGGGPLKFAAAAQHMAAIESSLKQLFYDNDIMAIALDGELVVESGTYYVFDMPFLDSESASRVLPENPYAYRREELEDLMQMMTFDNVQVVLSVGQVDQKRRLWEDIQAANVEGAMVKHRSAPYESGVRSKQQLKLKLVKSADVIVTSVERKFDHKGMVTHGSADLALRIKPEQDPRPWLHPVTERRISDAEREKLLAGTKAQYAKAIGYQWSPRGRLSVGAASLIGKDLTIDVGDVVEVHYLYWGGDALVQPRIVRKRLSEEKPADDCWLDQIPAYSREAVTI